MFDKKNFESIGEIIGHYLAYDLKNPEVQGVMQQQCFDLLQRKLSDSSDIQYLNLHFKFDKKGDMITVLGNNLISTLWLIGVYPNLPKRLLNKDVYTTKTKEYVYNPKTKKLVIIDLYVNPKHDRNN